MSEIKIPTEPLLVDAKTAARMIGVGKTKLYALHASGRLPEPIRLGRGVGPAWSNL
jgi:predicted DNA-binding transcriptional regulator AlpA